MSRAKHAPGRHGYNRLGNGRPAAEKLCFDRFEIAYDNRTVAVSDRSKGILCPGDDEHIPDARKFPFAESKPQMRLGLPPEKWSFLK